MSKTTKKAGDLAKATGGKKPPAAKAAPAKQSTEQVAEEATIEASEEVTEKASEQATDQVAEEATIEASEEVTEKASEQATDQAPDLTTDQKAEEATTETAENVTDKAPEQATNQETTPFSDLMGSLNELGEVIDKAAEKQRKLSEAKGVLEIMNRCKVDKLFRNPQGEYFTVLNFAMLSVDQDRKALQHYDRRLLEMVIKNIS